ncbi:hypothetical protein RFI_27160 [Reticulomyxa filosa]|uniref:B30.2/SPRY domain-containing protein n=1 Tax=Reticulomyxa filosa TaxID=46433 RepID=X6M987_RETFI|nr:hypothetical protein RFI_27160 [Reticulomyxa filosa]|eukprot:ETO10216.1 hypothetical protein RFI_27160 [Reticulomyxa filosa]
MSSAGSGDRYHPTNGHKKEKIKIPLFKQLTVNTTISSSFHDKHAKIDSVQPMTDEKLYWNLHKIFVPGMQDIQTFGAFYNRMRFKWHKAVMTARGQDTPHTPTKGPPLEFEQLHRVLHQKSVPTYGNSDRWKTSELGHASSAPQNLSHHNEVLCSESLQEEMFEMNELIHPECRYQSNDDQWMMLFGGQLRSPIDYNHDPYSDSNAQINKEENGSPMSEGTMENNTFMLWAQPIQIKNKGKGLIATARALLTRSPEPKDTNQDDIQRQIQTKPYEMNPVQLTVKDHNRVVEEIVMSPDGCYAALIDSLGRISIFDCTRLIVVRVFKGYRHGQVGWIFVNSDIVELMMNDITNTPQCQGSSSLPRRNNESEPLHFEGALPKQRKDKHSIALFSSRGTSDGPDGEKTLPPSTKPTTISVTMPAKTTKTNEHVGENDFINSNGTEEEKDQIHNQESNSSRMFWVNDELDSPVASIVSVCSNPNDSITRHHSSSGNLLTRPRNLDKHHSPRLDRLAHSIPEQAKTEDFEDLKRVDSTVCEVLPESKDSECLQKEVCLFQTKVDSQCQSLPLTTNEKQQEEWSTAAAPRLEQPQEQHDDLAGLKAPRVISSSQLSIITIWDDNDNDRPNDLILEPKLENNDPGHYSDKPKVYQNRQFLNDMPSSTHRRNVLLFVIYVHTRGLLEIYSIARKQRLYAVTIFPRCKLIYTYNWNTHPPWPYILFRNEDGKLYKLVVNSQILDMFHVEHETNDNLNNDLNSRANSLDVDSPCNESDNNIHERLKYFSVRRKEEWKYYSAKYFKVIQNTFIVYYPHKYKHDSDSHRSPILSVASTQSMRSGFHTAIGKYICSMAVAHFKGIQMIKWFVSVNECDGGLSIGVVQNSPDLSTKIIQNDFFDFAETEQGWAYGCNGTVKHCGNVIKYGSRYGTGDTITVILNLIDGCLAFSVNEKLYQIAFGKNDNGALPMANQSYRLAMSVGLDFTAKFSAELMPAFFRDNKRLQKSNGHNHIVVSLVFSSFNDDKYLRLFFEENTLTAN